MSNKTLTIEIEDIGDQRECVAAIRKLFDALRERHGATGAGALWRHCHDPAEMQASIKFNDACVSFVLHELRLVLEYYAMAKPSKLGLAK
jgi:hypothetical protein